MNDNNLANIIELDVSTVGEVPPDRVLLAAVGKLTEVAIVGKRHDGTWLFACSSGERERILWMLETGKQVLIKDQM